MDGKSLEEEEVEDLEKLQAEIARMEAEAARIAQETEDLERQRSSSNVPTPSGKQGNAVGASTEKSKKDG
jgi:hypothetical protein